jgi:hypothetical protein
MPRHGGLASAAMTSPRRFERGRTLTAFLPTAGPPAPCSGERPHAADTMGNAADAVGLWPSRCPSLGYACAAAPAGCGGAIAAGTAAGVRRANGRRKWAAAITCSASH